ncbi:methyltransferase type 11 [Natrinema mahii]|nr:methyltransferase type 11 [Natrinema mahii]
MSVHDDWETYFEQQFDERDPWSFETSGYERTKYERQLRVIRDHHPGPERILELGCAEGVHTEMLADTFDAEVVAVDISDTAIERARERIDDPRVTFVAADALEFVAEIDSQFDVIVWSELIYYLGDKRSVPAFFDYIATVSDRLRENGLLCLANIIDQSSGREAALTRAPVMDCYETMLSALLERVHRATYTEWKAESDSRYEYAVWAFRQGEETNG